MKTLKYVFLAALVFLVVKAFYLDKKIEEYMNEDNKSVPQEETPVVQADSSAPPVADQNTSHQDKPNYKDAPMEKVGDSIANKLDEKIKIPKRELPGTDTKAF